MFKKTESPDEITYFWIFEFRFQFKRPDFYNNYLFNLEITIDALNRDFRIYFTISYFDNFNFSNIRLTKT